MQERLRRASGGKPSIVLDLAAHAVVAERDLALQPAVVGQVDRGPVRGVGVELADVVQQRAGDGDVAVDAGEGRRDRADRLADGERVLEQPVAVGLVVELRRRRVAVGGPALRRGRRSTGRAAFAAAAAGSSRSAGAGRPRSARARAAGRRAGRAEVVACRARRARSARRLTCGAVARMDDVAAEDAHRRCPAASELRGLGDVVPDHRRDRPERSPSVRRRNSPPSRRERRSTLAHEQHAGRGRSPSVASRRQHELKVARAADGYRMPRGARASVMSGGTGGLGVAVTRDDARRGLAASSSPTSSGASSSVLEPHPALTTVAADLFDAERAAAAVVERRPRPLGGARQPRRRLRRRRARARDADRGLRAAVPAQPAPDLPALPRGAAAAARGRRRLDRVRRRRARRCARSPARPATSPRRPPCSPSSTRSRPSTPRTACARNAILPSVIDTPANRASAARRRPLALGHAGADRPRDPLPVLGGLGADERRAHPRLRAGVKRPALTVDVVAIARDAARRSVLLIERAPPAVRGRLGPARRLRRGGRARARCGRARARRGDRHRRPAPLELLGVYDTPGRDPRGWTVSVVYLMRADAPLDATRRPTTRATRAGSRSTTCRRWPSITRRWSRTRSASQRAARER